MMERCGFKWTETISVSVHGGFHKDKKRKMERECVLKKGHTGKHYSMYGHTKGQA